MKKMIIKLVMLLVCYCTFISGAYMGGIAGVLAHLSPILRLCLSFVTGTMFLLIGLRAFEHDQI